MFIGVMKGSILENQLLVLGPLLLLALLIRYLLPRVIKAEKAGVKFGLGVCVFIVYTLMLMLTIMHLVFGAVSVEDCMIRACVAVVLVNLMMLFVAAILFFTRDKRGLTQEEWMKLKDM